MRPLVRDGEPVKLGSESGAYHDPGREEDKEADVVWRMRIL